MSLETIIIPESISSIGEQAFCDCASLSEIQLPDKIDLLPTRVFARCYSLNHIEIPNCVQTIENSAFWDCISLSEIKIPESVQTIGMGAFSGCTNLNNIIFCGSNLTIGNASFTRCDNINSISCLSSDPPILDENAFPNSIYSQAILYVPEEAIEKYKNDISWSKFENIKSLSNSVVIANKINLNHESVKLEIGESLQLEATVLPEDATDKSVSWSSSNENVSTVDGNGMVTALNEGTVIITASCGEVSASCEITVVKPIVDVEHLILNIEDAELYIGNTLQLEATVLPEDASDKTVTWSSSDKNVATVSENGLVTAISEGSAIITATCGGVSASCLITVSSRIIEAEQIVLNIDSAELNIDETLQLEATVLPSNTTDKTIVWHSSNENVAAVSNTGLVTRVCQNERRHDPMKKKPSEDRRIFRRLIL